MKIRFAISHAAGIGESRAKRYWDYHTHRFTMDRDNPACHFQTREMADASMRYAVEKVHGGILQVEAVEIL